MQRVKPLQILNNMIRNSIDYSRNKNTHIAAPTFFLVFYIIRTSLVSLSAYRLFALPIIFSISIIAMVMYYVKYSKGRIEKCYLYLVMFLIYVFFCKILVSNAEDQQYLSGYLKQLMMLLLAFGVYSYMSHAEMRDRIFLGRTYFVCTIITAVYTCYVASVGPVGIIRNTAFGEYNNTFRFMYGGYDFIYTLVILYSILLICFIKYKRILRLSIRIFLVILLAFFAYTIIISGYSTAFVLILGFTVWNIISKKWLRISVLIVLLIILFGVPQIFTHTIDLFTFIPEMTAERIKDLILSLSGSSSVTYLSGEGERGQRILRSLRVFIEHPILGGYIGNASEGVGAHSELVDTLGRFGLIAYSCFIAFWVDSYKRIINNCENNETQRCVRSAIIMLIFLAIFDTVSLTNTIAPVFVFAPFCDEILGICDTRNIIV